MGIASSRYGYSTAVGLFQSLVNILLICITNKLSSKLSDTALF